MLLTLKKGGEFIPKFNGNDSLKEIVIHWKHLTYSEFAETSDLVTKQVDSVQIVKAMITKVDGLSVSAGGKVKKIEDSESLFSEEIPYDLMNEITTFCMSNFSPEMDPTA